MRRADGDFIARKALSLSVSWRWFPLCAMVERGDDCCCLGREEEEERGRSEAEKSKGMKNTCNFVEILSSSKIMEQPFRILYYQNKSLFDHLEIHPQNYQK